MFRFRRTTRCLLIASLLSLFLVRESFADERYRAKSDLTFLNSPDEIVPLLNPSDNKPVVVHFWATWCAACITDMDLFIEAANDAKTLGAHILMISVDEKKATKSVERYLRQKKIRFDNFQVDSADPTPVTKLVDPKWDGSLPATFILVGGINRKSIIGTVRKADLRAVIEESSAAK